MAWLSSVSWVSGDTPVLSTVLNNIGADIRTAGGNHDMAGYSIVNVGGIAGASGLLSVTTRVNVGGTASAATVSVWDASGADISIQYDGQARWWLAVADSAGVLKIGGEGATRPASGAIHVLSGGKVRLTATPVYADNTAAVAGGLAAGTLYRTSTGDLREVY